MICTTETPIADYYAEVFSRSKEGATRHYLREFRRAIEWLEIAIAKTPTLGDLSRSNILRMARMMYSNGCEYNYVDKLILRLCSIWLHASKAGIVGNYQRPKTPRQADRQQEFLQAPPKVGTVRRYYNEHMRPKLSVAVRGDYDPAVKQLDLSCNRYVTLDEVTDELLATFADWLETEAKTRSIYRRERFAASIKAIVRHHDPERFRRPRRKKTKRLPPAEPGTFRHFFETVHLPQRMIDVRPTTVEWVHRAYRSLYEHYGRDIMLSELSDGLAAEHLTWLRDKRHLKPSSINNGHRGLLFMVWRYAYEKGLVDRLPTARKLREYREEPDSWGPEEIAKLLAAVDQISRMRLARWRGPVPLKDWWRAFLLVCWWTGLRAGSLMRIELQHVDLETGWIYLPPAAMKTRRGKRFRVGADAIEAIRKIITPERKLLFEWPGDQKRLWKHFRAIQESAGLQHNGRAASRLHKLRRSVATQTMVNAGMASAIALLDHSGPEITKRYIDPSKLPGMDATEFLPSIPKRE